jgi:hypothetical protein
MAISFAAEEFSGFPSSDSSCRFLAMSLPVYEVKEELLSAFGPDGPGRVLLKAPTGSGKSTIVPKMLLQELPQEGRILVVSPGESRRECWRSMSLVWSGASWGRLLAMRCVLKRFITLKPD